MTRGFHLILAALFVASFCVAGAFAFTPSITPIPDVIQGDRTPPDTLLPSDPFTHADTLEETVLGTGEDIFEFRNALNIFNLVEDIPSGVAGFTSDDQLLYEFLATNVDPADGATANNARVSINGTRIATNAFTPVTPAVAGDLSFKDEAYSNDADNETFAAVGAPFEPFVYLFRNGAGAENVSTDNSTSPESLAIDLIDVVAMTIRVTNDTAVSASDEFFVYTVDNGPDALSGDLILGQQILDLSGWQYNGSANAAGAVGPLYAGDAAATGLQIPDADASVVNLRLTTGDTTGDFFHWFYSPLELIPFVQDGTYHISWVVSSTIATAAANPLVRFRWEYGIFGDLGGGSSRADSVVAAADADGREYALMFDQLDVAAASVQLAFGSITGIDENSAQLFFESIDFDGAGGGSSVGGGQVELDLVTLSQLNRDVLLAQGTLERAASDYTDFLPTAGAHLGAVGANYAAASAAITLSQTATNVTITAPAANPAGTITIYGGSPLTLADQGFGFVPFAPASPTGRFYRGSLQVDSTANSTTAPIPKINLQFATFSVSGQLFTNETDVTALRAGAAQGGTGTENPAANGVNTYSAYLAFPEGGDLSGGSFGNQVALNIRLQDSTDTQQGSIIVDQLQISSYPEGILP